MAAMVLTRERAELEPRERLLDATARMDAFLREVEARAFRITLLQVRDADEALDIVQDAMIKLVRRYAGRPDAEWPPLFYRILQNKTRDWHRRQNVRRRLFGRFERHDSDTQAEDPIDSVAATTGAEPDSRLAREAAMRTLENALHELPPRQREAFLLRNLEGLDVRATARAMGCTEGSVKTHYSRAVRRLRERLGEHWS